MIIRDQFDSTREARPEVLAFLDGLLSSGAVTSAHYWGYAHEPILRLLNRHLRKTFSVMDMPDRYGTGEAFFWDEDCAFPGLHRPDWLEGVPFYQEGVPEADLLIVDMPWSYPSEYSAIIERNWPARLLLIDEACSAASHRAYSWTTSPTYALGNLKVPNLNKPPLRQQGLSVS